MGNDAVADAMLRQGYTFIFYKIHLLLVL